MFPGMPLADSPGRPERASKNRVLRWLSILLDALADLARRE
jgi:hypothetical protein